MEFGLRTILDERINESNLKAYCVRFDFGLCQIEAFAEILLDALVDYAYGFHAGILEQYDRRVLKEAAKSLYKIQGFVDAQNLYLENDSVLEISEDEKSEQQKNYEEQIQKKGEFGELLLHTYLRDYFNTVPLLSKIFLKDTDGFTVHGFDAIHIGKDLTDESKDSLYLGESKIYFRSSGNSGASGVKDLAKDIECHIKKDFLYREFSLVDKKQHNFLPLSDYSDKNTISQYEEFLMNKDQWIEKLRNVSQMKMSLSTLLDSVTIPLLCTYESDLFKHFSTIDGDEFKNEYEKEVQSLQKVFNNQIGKIKKECGEPIRTDLNIILILLPIPSKKELVTLLHKKIWAQQNA